MLTQHEIIVQKVKNATLSVNDFIDETIEEFQIDELVGKGAIGSVYVAKDRRYVIKETAPCHFDFPVFHRYCEDLKKAVEEDFTKIPSGKKHRYLMPNLLSEAVIGMFFNGAINFTPTLSAYLFEDTESNPEVYSVMPNLTPLITKNILNPVFNDYFQYYFLFLQVASGLLAAQERFKFTHYDLHLGNILLDNWPEQYDYIEYPVPDSEPIQISKKLCPYIVKISDFGMSRLETEQTIITPKYSTFPEANFGEFNPTYDIMSFIGNTLFDYRFSPLFIPILTKNYSFFTELIQFILWIFNDKTISFKTPERAINEISYKYFKKTPEGYVMFRPIGFENNLVDYFNIQPLPKIIQRLAKIMKKNGLTTNKTKYLRDIGWQSQLKVLKLPYVKKYNYYDDVYPFVTTLSKPELPLSNQTTNNYYSNKLDLGINVVTTRVLYSSPPNDFNFTITKKQLETCPYQDHYATSIVIDPSRISKYSFQLQCCMLDPINYIRNEKMYGFIMNGGYFNIQDNYLPIGPYKDQNGYREYYEIPESYKDVYGYVCFSGNQLTITRNLEEAKQNKYLFSTGPYLIENGKIVFKPYDERFACINLATEPNVIRSTEEDVTVSGYNVYEGCQKRFIQQKMTFPRCDSIQPGELSHSDNPNPRSIVCILKSGKYIFMTIEGREERGVGIDLSTLSKMLIKEYPDIMTAINLDGGRSSNMTWRGPNKPKEIFVSNPEHLYQYPVGNIIVFKRG